MREKYTVIDEGGCELVTGPVPSHNVLDKEIERERERETETERDLERKRV